MRRTYRTLNDYEMQHNAEVGLFTRPSKILLAAMELVLVMSKRDLCKTPLFAQFRRQAQILILKILNVFLWLKFSSSLALNKIGHFPKVSKTDQIYFSLRGYL